MENVIASDSSMPTARLTVGENYLKQIPFGWYGVALSDELKVGDIRPLKYFAREFVLFRNSKGKAVALDPICPHYGAHLGVASRIEGDSLVCPFHGWQFNASGRCSHVPHIEKDKLPNVGVRPWHLIEKYGVIFVWYHPDINQRPLFSLPGQLGFEGENGWRKAIEKAMRININAMIVRENIFDAAHFSEIHQTKVPPDQKIQFNNEYASIDMQLSAHVFNKVIPVDFKIEMWGAGLLFSRSKGLIESYSIALSTPIDENRTELRFISCIRNPEIPVLSIRSKLLGFISEKLFWQRVNAEVDLEKNIWEHQTALDKPLFMRYEKSTRNFRKWYNQFFYSVS